MVTSEERLARVVHGAVAFGAGADEAVRLSNGSASVLALAMTFVDQREATVVPWQQILAVLRDAIDQLG
jgi:hypothetical protein